MRIAVINPPRFNGIPVIREDRCEITERSSLLPPYSLMQIASCLREGGHEVLFLDANEKNSSEEECRDWLVRAKPDSVLFRFTPTTYEPDMQIARISKQLSQSIQTIGICHTLNPVATELMKVAADLDYYVIGEDYEHTLTLLLDWRAKDGDLQRIPGIVYRDDSGKVHLSGESCPSRNLDSLPLPAFDLVSHGRYYNKSAPNETYMAIATSRGCPYSCSFCTVRKTPLRMKSALRVLAEIDRLVKEYHVRRLSFFDETYTMDEDRTRDICSGLVERNYGLKWYCNTRVDCVSRDLLMNMARAGCAGVSYGVESGSQRILDNARKGTSVNQALNAMKWAKEAHIKVYASFVLGLPGETRETLEETRRFVHKARPNGAQFNLAVPYPGTPLYDLARTNNWIDSTHTWLELYQHKAHMRTAELSQTELDDARIGMYKSLYFDVRWILDNIKVLIRNPQEFGIGLRYYLNGVMGLARDRMEHRH